MHWWDDNMSTAPLVWDSQGHHTPPQSLMPNVSGHTGHRLPPAVLQQRKTTRILTSDVWLAPYPAKLWRTLYRLNTEIFMSLLRCIEYCESLWWWGNRHRGGYYVPYCCCCLPSSSHPYQHTHTYTHNLPFSILLYWRFNFFLKSF